MIKNMNSQHPRSVGVCVLGWVVIIANILLYLVYYFNLLFSSSELLRRAISFISMTAVFPYDFFTGYFLSQWLPQTIWVMMTVVCAFGILLLNKFARAVFIILNIIQVVILGYLVLMRWGSADSLEYFFKFYFTAVISGSYTAFLTFPEVREQFRVTLEGLKLQIFLQKPLGKTRRLSDAEKYAGLSVAYIRLERYDDAVDVLHKAIDIDPEKPGYYFQLGMVYIKQGTASDAIVQLKKAIEKDPVFFEAYYNLGILYVQQGCHREAVEMFRKASHVRPDDAQLYRDFGDACYVLGNYEDAIEKFRKAVSLSRKDAYSYYRIGFILSEHLGRDQDALDPLRAAVRIQEDFTDAQFQLGKVYIKLERHKDAVRAFKEVIAQEEENFQAIYHLGFSYAMLKDYHSARRQYELLKQRDSGLAENLKMLLDGS
jgi:tetratricopeptide (TPR) repeat protein